MGTGVLLASFVAYIQIRIIYRDVKYYEFDEPSEVRGTQMFNSIDNTNINTIELFKIKYKLIIVNEMHFSL